LRSLSGRTHVAFDVEMNMRIAWERVGAVVLSVGIWTVLLVSGRHALHLARGEVHTLAHLALGRRGRFV
jgi:hypothetical protein